MSRHAVLLVLSAMALPVGGSAAPAPIQPAASSPAPAKPAHHTHARRHRTALHRPGLAPLPAPATSVAGNTSPAPVPNESITPPNPPTPTAEIAPKSFQLHYPPVGDGYVTGSSSQAMDDREAAKATGVQATVPLPQ